MGKIKQFLKKFIPTPAKKSDDLYKLTIESITEMETRKMPKTMLDYEVQLVEHCNLNCKSCSHFCPIADEEFLDVKEYERDCKRLSEIFDRKANFIRLMGGEPLLHPKICEFFKITRENFPNALIDLDTNGILVLSMKDNFWKSLCKYNINLTITKYPIKIDIERIKQKCKENNVKFRFFSEKPVINFNHLPLDEEGRQQIENSFLKCYLANSCHTLKHGKMFTCSTIPHVQHLNDYSKCNFSVTEDDYIDIYKTDDKQQILNFLSKPVPFCRYCIVNERKEQKWEISEKKTEEWVKR